MNGIGSLRDVLVLGISSVADVFSRLLVDPQMAKMTRKGSKKHAKGSRKGKRGQTPWMKKVMECYHRMKKQNPNTKLGDAMKQAKKEM